MGGLPEEGQEVGLKGGGWARGGAQSEEEAGLAFSPSWGEPDLWGK